MHVPRTEAALGAAEFASVFRLLPAASAFAGKAAVTLELQWHGRCFSVSPGHSVSLEYVMDSQELWRAGCRANQEPFLLTAIAIEIDVASVGIKTDFFSSVERISLLGKVPPTCNPSSLEGEREGLP